MNFSFHDLSADMADDKDPSEQMGMISRAQEVLAEYWGYPAFRSGQQGIIEAAGFGRDVLALLPTGGGKSICYQVPGLMADGLTLVISPLIALMDDQVDQLDRRGIRAYRIHSGVSAREISLALDNCISGPVKFLYISPERLLSSRFQASLPHLPLQQVAVDEAHCISQWGHDFRPAYQQIGMIRDHFPKIPIRAFTATATKRVRDDIISSLQLRDPYIHLGDIHRPGLHLRVKSTTDRFQEIIDHCAGAREQCGIIYVRNRKACGELAEALRGRGVTARMYHAGLSLDDREEAMAEWMEGKVKVMVATNAFGMGIDKADVRYVLHVEAPPDLESYYQEAGRAGRDGAASRAILFSQKGDRDQLLKKWSEQFVNLDICQRVYKQLAIDFQVAEGDLPEISFPMDLASLASRLNLPYTTVYHATRMLQLGGWIEWSSQGGQTRSLLHIKSSPDLLPETDQRFPFIGDLVRWILRLYEGVLSMPVQIRENTLAELVNRSTDQVRQCLQYLEQLELAEYFPVSGLPEFRFVQPRIRANNLRFAGSKVELLMNWQREKLDRVFRYLEGESCLYHQLSEYFDLPGPKACGHCSVCEKQAKLVDPVAASRMIFKLISARSFTSPDLVRLLEDEMEEHMVIKALEHLLNEEMIRFENGVYRINENGRAHG